ncbi:hypothetical protein CLV24_1142 [Pontibacter ummariensis]|uniref:Lipoprotein n=1 Tax=Pontibacter ummariensis TaxID=1610492 RepID=A0A239HJ46_9BACT|nr:hypothetical protein [Pontibacter ummariensis]PRY10274.1 hypothetical protein CLV24_1142 [Pontibacter ummariensis]SNS81165.1 hypothetical protein SAMN06296052_1142 [Pontibacter ummariensis]
MKKLFTLLLMFGTLLSLTSCTLLESVFKPDGQITAQVISLDSLSFTPADSAQLADLGVFTKRLSAKELLVITKGRGGKVKIKNSFNQDSYNKESGNKDSYNESKKSGNIDSYNDNKKAGQQQDVGNSKLKDVGNVTEEKQSLWWLWCLIILLTLSFSWPIIRRFLPFV